MATIGKFGFGEGAHGVYVKKVGSPLSSGCMHPDEIDYAVQALKDDLDAVAKKMKQRLEVRKTESIF